MQLEFCSLQDMTLLLHHLCLTEWKKKYTWDMFLLSEYTISIKHSHQMPWIQIIKQRNWWNRIEIYMNKRLLKLDLWVSIVFWRNLWTVNSIWFSCNEIKATHQFITFIKISKINFFFNLTKWLKHLWNNFVDMVMFLQVFYQIEQVYRVQYHLFRVVSLVLWYLDLTFLHFPKPLLVFCRGNSFFRFNKYLQTNFGSNKLIFLRRIWINWLNCICIFVCVTCFPYTHLFLDKSMQKNKIKSILWNLLFLMNINILTDERIRQAIELNRMLHNLLLFQLQ